MFIFGIILFLVFLSLTILRFKTIAGFKEVESTTPKDKYELASKEDQLENYRKTIFSFTIGKNLALVGAIIFTVCSFLTVIPAGYTGLVVVYGQVNDTVLAPGLHIVNPFAEVFSVDMRISKSDINQEAETVDTQTVKIQTIINWRFTPSEVSRVYKTIGIGNGKMTDTIIIPASQEIVKAEVAKHKVSELISKRPEMKSKIQEDLRTWLSKYGLIVEEVAVANIDFSEKYDQAIETKQVEEQKAQQLIYEQKQTETRAIMAKLQAEGEANSRIEKARGEAESVKLGAQAEADSLKIRGAAQAEYNRMVAQSLSPELVKLRNIEKWDGVLPKTILSDKNGLLLNIEK